MTMHEQDYANLIIGNIHLLTASLGSLARIPSNTLR